MRSTHGRADELLKARVEVQVCYRYRARALAENGHLTDGFHQFLAYLARKRSTYLGRIAAKDADIVLHPLQADELVLEPEVERAALCGFVALREPERSHTVVDAHVHNRRALWYMWNKERGWSVGTAKNNDAGCVTHTCNALDDHLCRVVQRRGAVREPSAVYPHHHRQRGRRGRSCRSEYIERETVL